MNSWLGRRFGGWVCGCCVLAGVLGAVAFAQNPAPPAAAKRAPSVDAMLTRVFPSIVRIEAIRLRPSDGRLTKQWTGGSGVIISPQGHVLTNCHVTEDGDFFRCHLFDGSHVEATRVGQDALTDLAVLQIDLAQRAKGAPPLVVAEFGDSSQLASGNAVFALGSPGFLAQSVTRGVVSNPSLVLPEQTAGKMILRGEDVGTLVRWVLHDARIFGGNSGGPLVNERGDVVGINEIGVFNLSGAIPSNLARVVADQIIGTGRVTRGWSGLTVQPRLEADGNRAGVMVGDVAAASPAGAAGLQPGDVIVACDGHAIEGAEEKAVAHFNRLETSQMPGNDFLVEFVRAGQKQSARLKLARRELAQADDVELRSWGAVVRDLTQKLIRQERLPDARGVWLENIRPAGPCGQAEPTLRRNDVLIAVDGAPIGDVAALRELTATLLAGAPKGVRTVLASVRREGAVLTSVVELRTTSERNPPQEARKAWLGASSQPLTPKLSTRLGIKAEGGARLTRIYPGTQAEAAGLRVGDVIVALDGAEVPARRPEDTDVLARQIRQYRSGTQAVFGVWRDGRKMDVPVTLEPQPVPAAEMPWWEDVQLEFSAREIAFDDRVRLQLPMEAKGALVESAVPAGWAALAGLRADDVIEAAGGKPVANLAELKQERELVVASGKQWWVLLVRRRGQTLFVEITLKPVKSKS
ncbi:MAG: PDZ domain-containing protein [Verrucomicrobia bacterium]|nr:PDZ domain-containing protein [Verrucomicrobiota bacterium]